MADEIRITSGMSVANGLLVQNGPVDTMKFTQTTARAGILPVDVGTTEETINFGDRAPGYILATNLDTTNFVRLRFSTGANAIRLLANGGKALFYLESGVTLYAIADTAACRVKFEWFNA